ncbi:sigma-54 interaction domain-containing protein [Nitratidesulfovibrio sp. SRB-5]|uniref:sigma-54 interaction domain-containing protein n=1 Tax=Nitratidesulfovibrio sp. SRB-5 TaxID=2872636 RepID=UPI001027FC3B|nr:sigma 54-interacting transcriptional regulator [Nitratidesulfovibrio sp. SRB-5]MBZ2170579.1 sigma 54-interacting transcriptional regulator [Nitratidesulfovibrio sp. SRB-5]RXF75228.1 sigma-54-dependent Fis family transcriptional regulator [Desulfovibrio sp. DS-1]
MSQNELLDVLIDLCDDLAWARPASEDRLFALTAAGSAPASTTRLAEAFGMMLVKVEAREYQQAQLIEELKARNAELEEARRLLTERNARLTHTLQESFQARRVIGQCPAMRQLIEMALSIARRPINTLLLGPTGAGKEVVAKLIHYNSPRREGPFIAVNCTAIPEALFESEMFGIEKGVATGVGARKGLVEEADGGTLFLDELADMPLPHQAKLLRVLEEREVQRVGSSKAVPVDLKVIAATNVDLQRAVREGKFREDLYYRINVAEVHLPPLRERGDDILLLAQAFLDRHCTLMGRPRLALSYGARDRLLRYPWPGNVRELNNEMERAAALTLGDRVEAANLSPRLLTATPGPGEPEAAGQDIQGSQGAEDAFTKPATPLPDARAAVTPPPDGSLNLQDMERDMVIRALDRTGGNKSRAAELLGITREGLRKKLLRLGIADGGQNGL